MPGRVQSGVDPMAATRPTRWSIPASAIEISPPIEKPPATTLLVDTSWWATIQSRTHIASRVLWPITGHMSPERTDESISQVRERFRRTVTVLPWIDTDGEETGAGKSFEHGERGVFRASKEGKPQGDAAGHVVGAAIAGDSSDWNAIDGRGSVLVLGPSHASSAHQRASDTNSGWSSRRSQVPSGWRRATCARAPAPSLGGVEVSAMSPLIRVGNGASCSKRGALASTSSHNSRMASRPLAAWPPG